MRPHVLLLVVALMSLTSSTSADDATGFARCPVPVVLLADDSIAPQDYVCCFGAANGETCSRKSPSKGGCEFDLAYRCGAPGYICDDVQEICKRNAPAATGNTTETTQ